MKLLKQVSGCVYCYASTFKTINIYYFLTLVKLPHICRQFTPKISKVFRPFTLKIIPNIWAFFKKLKQICKQFTPKMWAVPRILIRGLSTTTWTEFCHFLTPSPPLRGQFLYPERGQKQTFYDLILSTYIVIEWTTRMLRAQIKILTYIDMSLVVLFSVNMHKISLITDDFNSVWHYVGNLFHLMTPNQRTNTYSILNSIPVNSPSKLMSTYIWHPKSQD